MPYYVHVHVYKSNRAQELILLFQISRPDGKTESLGLSVLDEPCAKQSDRTVLDLQIRAVSKQTAVKPMVRTAYVCTKFM